MINVNSIVRVCADEVCWLLISRAACFVQCCICHMEREPLTECNAPVDAAQQSQYEHMCTGWAKNRATLFFLRLVTLEILIRSAPNLAQMNAISFLT